MTSDARVVLISYTHKPAPRVVSYAHFLRDHGLDVDLITWDADKWRAVRPALPPDVRVYSVREQEARAIVPRLESLVVHRIPGAILGRLASATQSNPVTRPCAPIVAAAQHLHQRLASAFHRRVFRPAYAVVRPRVVARATTKALGPIDFGVVDRIVATDAVAITYASRLARQFPDTPAVTRLDRHPYLQGDEPATPAAATA